MLILFTTLSNDEKLLVNEIFSKHHIKMYNISLRLLRSKQDAEEAVQESFLKIIDHIEIISKLSYPEIAPYCIVIAKNISINMLRRKSRIIYLDEIDNLSNDDVQNTEGKVFEDIDKDILLRTIDLLPRDEKYLVHLHWGNDLSYREIGEILEISEETAKKRGQRVLKKLRNLV